MDLKERDAIEAVGFTPRFSQEFKIHEGTCTVCRCHVDDHWRKLHANTNKECWVGCTGALLKYVQMLEGMLGAYAKKLGLEGERDSRLRGDLTREKSKTPAVESRVDGDAA